MLGSTASCVTCTKLVFMWVGWTDSESTQLTTEQRRRQTEARVTYSTGPLTMTAWLSVGNSVTQQREVTEEVDHWTTVCHCPSDKQLNW